MRKSKPVIPAVDTPEVSDLSNVSSALKKAIQEPKPEKVAPVASPNINKPVDLGRNTVLILAVLDKNYKLVSDLLEKGANPNTPNCQHWTALHCACKLGDHTLIQELVKAGGDMSLKNLDGMTCWRVLELCRHRKLIEVLKLEGIK